MTIQQPRLQHMKLSRWIERVDKARRAFDPGVVHFVDHLDAPRWLTDFGCPKLSAPVVDAMSERFPGDEGSIRAFHAGVEDFIEPIFHERLSFDIDSIVIRKSQFDKWTARA